MSSNQKIVVLVQLEQQDPRPPPRHAADHVPDIASLVQTNPASSTQAKYTGIHNKLVFESSFSIMDGIPTTTISPDTPAERRSRRRHTARQRDDAAQRHEEQPN